MKIAILGAGAFGMALGGILASKGYDIDYYDAKIERERLSDVVYGAEYILVAVPSEVIAYILPHLPSNIPLIIATKGILSDAVFANFSDYMILSGPGFADDIKAKKETYLTSTDKRIDELFKVDYIKFDHTDDKKGVLMCGALKNVYAIYAGLLGLKKGSFEWGAYIEKVLKEMRGILALNGGNAGTVDLVCGIGDLKLTCNYPSRNYEFGDKLRRRLDYAPEKTVEGVSTIRRIIRGEIKVPKDASILREIMAIGKNFKF